MSRLNEQELQRSAERLVNNEVVTNMSCIVSEFMIKNPEFFDEFPELIDGYFENEEGEEEYFEIYEYWAVSHWFADKLILKGERVSKDFYGHCVWGRTTTGQSIAMDCVIRQLAANQ